LNLKEDVFNHFIRNAKRDFSDFNEENPVGCRVEKDITTGGPKPTPSIGI
ncbi:MAG: hypothetical protein Q607_CBUC00158G0001, partial [Clostridium butyricum DORA_1]